MVKYSIDYNTPSKDIMSDRQHLQTYFFNSVTLQNRKLWEIFGIGLFPILFQYSMYVKEYIQIACVSPSNSKIHTECSQSRLC